MLDSSRGLGSHPSVPTIDGYTNLIAINSGGSSIIYSAHDERHSRSVAIKSLVTKTLDPTIRDGFVRELHAMGRLSDHPHIVSVFDSGFAEDGSPFLVMPLFVNGSYADRLAQSGPLDWVETTDIAIKILSALETAHQRDVTHRDIKPSNLFVGHYKGHPILGDFGISTLTHSEKTTTKSVAYTLAYVAPEVLDGERQSKLSDIYSLGATFRAFLTGTAPFSAENSSGLITKILTQQAVELPGDVPIEVVAVLDALTARQPCDRPPNCREAAEELQRAQEKYNQYRTAILIDEAVDQAVISSGRPSAYRVASKVGTAAHSQESPDFGRGGASLAGQTVTETEPAPARGVVSMARSLTGVVSLGVAAVRVVSVRVMHSAASAFGFIRVRLGAFAKRLTAFGKRAIARLPRGGGSSRELPVRRTLGRLSNKITKVPSGRRTVPVVAGLLLVCVAGGLLFGTLTGSGPAGESSKPEGQGERPLNDDSMRMVGHSSFVSSLAFSPDGKAIASGSWDESIIIWDVPSGMQRQRLPIDSGAVWSLAFSPDGETLVVASDDNSATLWATESGDSLGSLEGHAGTVWSVAFSPTGNVVATASEDQSVRLWDPESGEELQTLDRQSSAQLSVAFSPDGKMVAAGARDGVVTVWDVSTGRELLQLKGHQGAVPTVAFGPDGSVLASGGNDKDVLVWNLSTGTQQQRLSGHRGAVLSVVFDPSGGTLGSASESGEVWLWRKLVSEQLEIVSESSEAVYAIAFSPDGKTLASGGDVQDVVLHAVP